MPAYTPDQIALVALIAYAAGMACGVMLMAWYARERK